MANSLLDKTITLAELAEKDVLPEEFVYKEIGGYELKFEVFRGCAAPGVSQAAVVCIHGGGWSRGCKEWFRVHARYFAQRGMVAFSIDYRLVNALDGPGNGEPLVSLADAVEDCKSAVRFIRRNAEMFNVDVNRICVLGDSAGAHLAALISGTDCFDNKGEDLSVSSRPDMAVLCNGIYSFLRNDLWSSKMPDYPLSSLELEAVEKLDLDGSMSNSEMRNCIMSPISFCNEIQGGCFILHGTRDTVVSIEQSYEFYKKLKNNGVRAAFVCMGNAQHAFILPWYNSEESTVVNAIRRIDEFLVLNKYLSGQSNLVEGHVGWNNVKPQFEYD